MDEDLIKLLKMVFVGVGSIIILTVVLILCAILVLSVSGVF